MKYMNRYCADAGTANCPCPLAETGDCLICSRLSGKEKCDCRWCGICIYNEFIQNDGKAKDRRKYEKVRILSKTRYTGDLIVLELKVSKGIALNASMPGSFVFLKCCGEEEYYNVPISVMRADVQNSTIFLAIKILSSKTKAIAEADDFLMLRGIYRNGLIGEGIETLEKNERWLVMTRGAAFAPAVNLLDWSEGKGEVHMVIDTTNITEEIVCDMIKEKRPGCSEMRSLRVTMCPLEEDDRNSADEYDKVIILASDYYIRKKAEELQVPQSKLIYSNNFHMCCGEGICGACCHIDENGGISKMCKCRQI